ncbi:NAD(P)H-binding protein [Dactylosporangium sp. CS-047395]|uniref:NmrA family NAD(P)-binding protein n=1 Tax=Dactylosporangium sp. CS-047395 TaxID=3239936 RepID=UPI003D923CC9
MQTVLVIGASGKVGRHVVAGSHAAGAKVRALTRDPLRATGRPATVVRGDLTDPRSLAAAAEGVDAVYLMWPFFTAAAAPAALDVLAGHAARVVLLSSGSVDGTIPAAAPIARFHAEVERTVEQRAAEWTILRPAGFAADSLDWAASIRAAGVVAGAFPDAAGAWIHEADIAAVAVHALLDAGHDRQRYALTGPQSLTMAEQARIIGEVTGRPVRWQTRSRAEASAQLIAEGWPDEYAEVALRVQEQLTHAPAEVTGTVADITGEPARTYRQWVADHADAFR